MKHTIYFVRHGETDWNKARRFQGRKDIPLNELGQQQARHNGRTLKTLLPDTDLPFIASPLIRTRKTMELVREEMGLAVDGYETDDRLMEISFGEFEGASHDEVDRDFTAQRETLGIDRYTYTPEGGESYEALYDRVSDIIGAINTDTVIVSHGGVNRVVRGFLLNIPPHEMVTLSTPQDKVFRFSASGLDLF